MNKYISRIPFILALLYFLSCDNTVAPRISKCDSLKSIVTGNWVASYVQDNLVENNVDSSKCIDGIPYDFYSGVKVEKEQNIPPEPEGILDFTIREFWQFNENDSLYIERTGYSPTSWICVNDEIQEITSPGFAVYYFSLGWSCDENNIELYSSDSEGNTQILEIVSLTDSTFWLKIPGEEKTVKLLKNED